MTAADFDLLDDWGLRIASWAAPREAGLAAQTTRAYATGGTVRRQLYATGASVPGGMGGGAATLLPAVLDALACAADALKAALGSAQLGNALSATALVLGLRAERAARTPGAVRTSGAARAPGRTREEAPPQAAAEPPPPGTPDVEVMRALLRMSGRLRARGLEPAAADEVAAGVTARLLAQDDPAAVADFLDALVGGEPPQATTGDRRRSRSSPGPGSVLSALLSRLRRPYGPTRPAPSAGEGGTPP
ncbi:hypothetical protein [Streptomyces apricus]|uniref:Uncharacterized protein n=1 Tax=Streptomyces apricus TaxID=1828112 RepID=A0A5B0BIN9_9ACTN|nr:hypothetical protein [Streptomyces apricus]KAA0941537.1 hypothetical protein FGF04_06200 [Streptomyces apricus]